MPESGVQYQVKRNPESHFVKGQSGNPAGKPQGCQSHASRTAEIMLDGQVEALTPTGMARALEGDGLALRLCLDRIIARRAALARCISICRRSPRRPTSRPPWPR